MKPPYLKFYKEVEGLKVFIIDGDYVRNNLNGEFTNFAEHFRFPNMIPPNEIWLDKCRGNNEYRFFIHNAKTENTLMSRGETYDHAHKVANQSEEAMRKQLLHLHRTLRKEHYGTIGQDGLPVQVFIVDGEEVRNKYDIDFTEGGHDLVYKWIPNREIWIDDKLNPKERLDIMVHESTERKKMSQGLRYEAAHQSANIVEHTERKSHKLPKLFKFVRKTAPSISGMRK